MGIQRSSNLCGNFYTHPHAPMYAIYSFLPIPHRLARLHSWQHHLRDMLILWKCSSRLRCKSTYRIRYATATTRKHNYLVKSIVVLDELTVCFCPQDGWTALHLAAQEGKVDVVRLLTEAKAHVNIQTEVHTLCHIWSTDLDSHLILSEHVQTWNVVCLYM